MARRMTEPKPAAPEPETAFVEMMLVAADYVRNCGGVDQAKKSLAEAGHFIERSGDLARATKALEVLEQLRTKINE